MKNEGWRSSSEFYGEVEYRKALQSRDEEVRQKKELVKRGNIGLNMSSIYGNMIVDKTMRAEQKKHDIWLPKKEKKKAEGYGQLPDKDNMQRITEDVREQVAHMVQIESANPSRAAPKEVVKTYGVSGHSLEEYSRALLAEAKLINVDGHLYIYNDICYESCSVSDLITFYRDHIDRGLHGARGLATFRELYKYLLADSRLVADESKMAPAEYCFLTNGIFDVKKQRLKKHTDNTVAFSFVNARYVENPVCKRFDRFVDETTGGDKTLTRRFWYMLAYIFIQSMEAKVFFVLGIAKNSGKSLVGNLIRNLFLSKHVSAIALNDMNMEFSLAPIVGAAVNINMDLPKGRLNNNAVSRVKQLTGGDLVPIHEKFAPDFAYLNRAKLIFGTNHPITLTGEDDAFWSRMVFIPFMHSVPPEKQKAGLLKKFLEEKDSIVSKALQYGRDLIEDHYIFPSTSESRSYIASWRNDGQYFIDKFLEECCDTSDVTAREFMSNLYSAYCAFYRLKGSTQIYNQLKSHIEQLEGVDHFKMRPEPTANPRSAFIGIALSENGRRLLQMEADKF